MGFNLVVSRVVMFAAALALTACEVNLNSEGIVSRETKTFKVAGTPDLHLDTFDGSIDHYSTASHVTRKKVTRFRSVPARLGLSRL